MPTTAQIPSNPAIRPGESARPDLWQGLASLWAPCVQRGFTDATWTARNTPLPDLGFNRLGLRKSNGVPMASPFGRSIKFSGSGSGWVEQSSSLTAFSFIQKTARFTVAALLRPDTISTFGTVLDNAQGTTASSGSLFYIDSSGRPGVAVYRASPGNTTLAISGTTALALSQWALVVWKCDGVTGSVWAHGHRYAGDATVTVLSATDSTYFTTLGSYGGGASTNPFNGQVAYLGVWNRALPHHAVQELTADPLLLFRRPRHTVSKGRSFNAAWARGSNVIIQPTVSA